MRIHLPAETWEEILNWLKRPKFAKKMEQLWDREFTQIAHNWLHKWHRNVCIGKLQFQYCFGNGANLSKCTLDTPCVVHYEGVPIADVELPGNITSFQMICISYLDPIVMNFLHQMRSILTKVHLLIGGSSSRPTNKLAFCFCIGLLLPTITGPLESLSIFDEETLHLFKDYFPTVLANAKMLSYHSDEGSSVSDWTMQCLANWLFSPYEEGQPRKLLFIVSEGNLELYNSLIEEIRKRFLIPNRRSCSFFIKVSFLETHNAVEDSFNENIAMGEQLTMRNVPSAKRDEDQWQLDEPLDVRKLNGMLIRCHSNNEDKERIAEIEQELLHWDVHEKERRIPVNLWQPEIGQGIEAANENNVGEDEPGTSQQQANGSQSDEEEEEASTKPDEED